MVQTGCLFSGKIQTVPRSWKIMLSCSELFKVPRKCLAIQKYNGKVEKILFSSVVPKTYKFIKSFLEKKLFVKCKELKSINLKTLLKIKVNKKQVGSDRIANAIAVYKKNKNFIVIDFGTATTLDVITHNIYLGGVIAPGVKLSLETLISRATLIPKVNLSKIKKVIGNNTKNAVKSGFYWGYSGLIISMIKLIIKQTSKSFDQQKAKKSCEESIRKKKED